MTNSSKQTASQKAELARLRAEKAAAAKKKADAKQKAKSVEFTEHPKLEVASSAPQAEENKTHRTIEELMQSLGFGEGPSFKRKLAAFFVSAALSFGAGYAIGTVAGYAIVAIATLGGSVLWAWLIMLLAIMLSIYAGIKIGGAAANYILSNQIDKDIAAAKNKVTGWFAKKPLTIAA